MRATILVRNITENNQAAAAEIWQNGLQQTVDAIAAKFYLPSWFMNHTLGRLFNYMATQAMSLDGDVGPNGSNLCKHWKGDDRCMFIACAEQDKVIGLVGVKKGAKEQEAASDDDASIASIWRLSVSEAYRGQGVAEKLMLEAEKWAKENQCHSMTLNTMNPIASKFYIHKMKYTANVSCTYTKQLE
mmetsp:Transcript_13200/g.19216  ORF Transcript_13200/g.19216 Transcript_13200/m.19216 type:complete len:187 (+) Transcript_13200:186-746(+)